MPNLFLLLPAGLKSLTVLLPCVVCVVQEGLVITGGERIGFTVYLNGGEDWLTGSYYLLSTYV